MEKTNFAGDIMSFKVSPGCTVFGWSGLGSARRPTWQAGVRTVVDSVGGQFIPSRSGYKNWKAVAKAIIDQGIKHVFLCGHSNGNVATTSIAKYLKPHGIQCTLLCLDRTMKSCEKLGFNVPRALDIWAGPTMKRLQKGPDFKGELIQKDFIEESHIGMQQDKEVIQLGVDFVKDWKKKL